MTKKHLPIIILIAIIMIVAISAFVEMNTTRYNIVSPVVKSKSDIEVFLPKPNEIISSPLLIKGVVRGDGWSGFEGQVGWVELRDNNGNILSDKLKFSVLKTTTDWGILPTYFETDLLFDNNQDSDRGQLIFHNENPSGMPERDKTFIVPVKFK